MLISNGSILNEKCYNIALAKPNVYEDSCGVTPQQSNCSVFSENGLGLSDWTDAGSGDGVVSEVEYVNKKRFKFDSGSGSGNNAWVTQDVGSFGNRVVATIKLNSSLLGLKADNNHFSFVVERAGVRLVLGFASDGLFIYVTGYTEVGTNLVSLDTDQVWTFDCDFTTPATASCDIYLNGVLQASSVDCSSTGTYTEGKVSMIQQGESISNCVTYVDSIEIGDDLITDGIDTWVDTDNGTGAESSQAVFQGDSWFKLDSGVQSGSNYARIERDIGSFDEDRIVLGLDTYFEALGIRGDTDLHQCLLQKDDVQILIQFATDGLFVYDGAAYNEAGTDLVEVGEEQSWTFDITVTTPASATMDIMLNGVVVATGIDCSYDTGGTEGFIQFTQHGYTTANRITYVKNISIGDKFLWNDDDTGTGVSSQATHLTKSRFKFTNAGSTGSSNTPTRTIYFDEDLGDRIVFSVALNFDLIGTYVSGDTPYLYLARTDVCLHVEFSTNGIYVHDGADFQNIINLAVLDTDQVYTFDCDFSTPASASCDIYLDGVLKIAGVDCSHTGTFNQRLLLGFYETTTADQVFYVNNLQVGDNLVQTNANYEDFLADYTETDPNSHITVEQFQNTVAALARNEDAYVHKDFGAGHFAGDFRIRTAIRVTAHSDNGEVVVLGLANTVNDWRGNQAANEPQLLLKLDYATSTYRIQIHETDSGTLYSDTYNCVQGKTYYIEFVRSITEATHGKLYAFIYEDEDYTLWLYTLELDLHADIDFKCLFPVQSGNDSETHNISGWAKNLELVSYEEGEAVFTVNDTYHVHIADEIQAFLGGFTVNSSYHEHIVDQLQWFGKTISLNDAYHEHFADEVTAFIATLLLDSAYHEHFADKITIPFYPTEYVTWCRTCSLVYRPDNRIYNSPEETCPRCHNLIQRPLDESQ